MRIPLALVFLLFALRISAQGLGFHAFTLADGLPQNTITTSYEDSEGFLWFGTQDGLCRYDGYSFRVFRNEPGNRHSLADNYVLRIFEDDRHRLWIGCRNGLSTFDRHTETFTAIHVRGSERFFPRNSFYFQQPEKKTLRIWGNGTALEMVNDSTASVVAKNADYTIFFPGHTGNFSLGDSALTANGHRYPFPSGEKMKAWTIGRNGLLEICTARLLLFFDPAAMQLSSLALPDSVHGPFTLAVDHLQRTWLGTSAGLYLLAPSGDNGQWKKISTPGSPAKESIASLFCDSHHTVWIGTDYAGLYRYDPFSEIFCHAGETTLDAKQVWAFYETQPGELWIGTGSGLRLFSNDKNQLRTTITQWSADPDFSSNAARLHEPELDVFEGKTISALTGCGDSSVWIGTKGSGIYRYDRRKKKLVAHYSSSEKNEARIPAGTIYCFAATGEKLYAGTSQGIAVIDLRTGITDSIRPSLILPRLNSNYIMSLLPDGDALWIGTSLGLLYYNLRTHEVASYFHEADKPASFPNFFVSCITPDPQHPDQLYLGTLGSGIVVFDRIKRSWRLIDHKNGLTNSSVYGVIFSGSSCWASTNAGIAQLDPVTGKVIMFTSRDGLGSNEFSQNAWYRSKSGELFFGTANGFTCFRPGRITLPAEPPRLLLNAISINYQPVAANAPNIRGSRSLPEELLLWPTDRVLTIEYAGFAAEGNRPLTYRYRLAGFDDQWVTPVNGQRTISYTSLPPGGYTLELSASEGPDDTHAVLLKIPVTVYPPFYATWWFRVLAALLILLLLAFTVRYFSQRRLRRKLRELQTQRRIQEERERISRDLHDNVGAQLTYIITTLDNIALKMRKPGQEAVAQEKLETLGTQARHTMQQLRESIWAINSTSITLGELAQKTKDFMQQLAENQEQVQWSVKLEGETLTLKPSTAIQLFRILQEAVSNAFRHASAQHITVLFRQENGSLQVRISDDGCGFDPGAEKAGHYGMKNMPLRAQQVGGKLDIVSAAAKGTTITITLPLI